MQAVITTAQVLLQEEGNLISEHAMLYHCIPLNAVKSSSLNLPILVTRIDTLSSPYCFLVKNVINTDAQWRHWFSTWYGAFIHIQVILCGKQVSYSFQTKSYSHLFFCWCGQGFLNRSPINHHLCFSNATNNIFDTKLINKTFYFYFQQPGWEEATSMVLQKLYSRQAWLGVRHPLAMPSVLCSVGYFLPTKCDRKATSRCWIRFSGSTESEWVDCSTYPHY